MTKDKENNGSNRGDSDSNYDGNLDADLFNRRLEILNEKNKKKLQKKENKKKRRKERRSLVWKNISVSPVKLKKGIVSGLVYINKEKKFFLLFVFEGFRVVQTLDYRSAIRQKEYEIVRLQEEIQKTKDERTIPHFLKKHWRPIVAVGGSVLIPTGRHLYRNWETRRELRQTKEKLKSQTERTTELELDSQIKLKELKDLEEKHESTLRENELRINKLHVTLNRFNSAAMKSAKNELKVMQRIKDLKNQLASAIEERDTFEKSVKDNEKMLENKNVEVDRKSVEMKVLKKQIAKDQDDNAELLRRYEEIRNERNFLNFQKKRLENEIKKSNEARLGLVKKLGSQEIALKDMEGEKKRVEKKLESEHQKKREAAQKIEELRAERAKGKIKLQEAIEKTNRYAREMDKTQSVIDDYKSENIRKTERIKKQEQKILEMEQKSKKLEEKFEMKKEKLSDVTISNEELKREIQKAEEEIKKVEGKNLKKEKELEKVIEDKQKIIKKNEKAYSKLKTELDHQENAVRRASLNQEKLRAELGNLEKVYKEEKKKSFLERLKSERQEQEISVVINEVLDQQEKDQKQRWWQRLPIHFTFHPELSLPKNKEKPVVEREREHHFYPSFAQDHPQTEVVRERYNPETEEWEVLEPSQNNTLALSKSASYYRDPDETFQEFGWLLCEDIQYSERLQNLMAGK